MKSQGTLFNQKTIERLCADVKISPEQKKSAYEWFNMLESETLKKEKLHYLDFAVIILKEVLGYPIKTTNGMSYEEGNVEFVVSNNEGKQILCIEAKGTETKDLHAPQHRKKEEHSTPIKQTWDYIGSIGLDYGICTNYKDFILITKQHGYSKYYEFDFTSIKNEEKLKEFVGIFSKERIIERGFIEKLHNESVIQEREFTKEFYKLFHETRLMLIMALEKENVTKTEAIYYTQLFLNRLIFIFFVEDRGFIPDKKLFTNRILKLLESSQLTEHSRKIYDDIKELFVSFDKGSRVLGVFGFNGGLFDGIIPDKIYFSDLKEESFFAEAKLNSNLLKTTKLNDRDSKIINKIKNLNPIISRLLIMDSFNFNTEVSVNILGHIFEQSISDLEELKKEGISRRKKDGVFYTHEHITDYICRNTIIPYLSKSNLSTVAELIYEYEDNLEELENKLKEIKILDPACGSGAFLIKAIDILLEIDKEIQSRKGNENKSASEQLQITQEWDEEKEIRIIIENNIYGVDINQESIEITKLSLFLKLASSERKLMGLSKNIQIGNSLLENKDLVPNAFAWADRFPEILNPLIENRGFSVVIGNPPYFNLASNDILKNSDDYPLLINGVLNVASLFLKKGINILEKNKGFLGYIIPKSFLTVDSWKPIRDLILEHSLIIANDVGKQWDEVGLEQTIIIVKNNPEQVLTTILGNFREIDKIPQELFKKRDSILTWLDKKKLLLVEKIEKNSIKLGEIADMPRGMTVKSSEYFSEKHNNFVQVLGGTNIERFLVKDGNKRKPNRFLESTDSRINSKREIYSQKRIVYQNVASSVPKIVATIEDQKLPTDDTINNLILNNKNYSYEDILAILNSDLITFYLRYAIINNSELTVHLDKPYVGNIPIKNPKGSISKHVEFILKNKKIITVKNTKFFNRVFERFPNITISKKLERYYEMSFSEFIQELEKNCKKISLKEKDEWEDYFNEYSSDLLKLSNQIEKYTEELNKLVYTLYEINSEEIEMIKTSLNS